MSSFHIIYNIRIDIETKEKIEKIEWISMKNNDLKILIDSELHHYTMNWIRRIFLIGKLEVISCGYNPNDKCYHSWLRTTDGSNITAEQLSKALYFVKPENANWYKEDCKILDKKELNEVGLISVRLVPLINKVLVTSENMVEIGRAHV